MTDTIYTPSEMLDRIEARVAELGMQLRIVEAGIEAAHGRCAELRVLASMYVACAGRIAALFDVL